MESQTEIIEKLRDRTLSKGIEKSTSKGRITELKYKGITIRYSPPKGGEDIYMAAQFPYTIAGYKNRFLRPRNLLFVAEGSQVKYCKNGWRQEVQPILDLSDG